MTKPSFVGFQEKVVIPEGFQLVEVHESLKFTMKKDLLFALLATPDGISQWLYHAKEIDLRPGGKIKYIGEDGSEGQDVCTSVVLEKELSIISEHFGNFSARIHGSNKQQTLEMKFSILTDKVDEKRDQISRSVSRLKAIIE